MLRVTRGQDCVCKVSMSERLSYHVLPGVGPSGRHLLAQARPGERIVSALILVVSWR